MKKLTEEQAEEIKKEITTLISGYLVWKIREIAGQFATDVSVQVRFQDEEGGYNLQLNGTYSPDYIQRAETEFLAFEKNTIVAAARKFMEEGK